MKVKELIKGLSALNPDLYIFLAHNIGKDKIQLSAIQNVLHTQFKDANSEEESMLVIIVDESTRQTELPKKRKNSKSKPNS